MDSPIPAERKKVKVKKIKPRQSPSKSPKSPRGKRSGHSSRSQSPTTSTVSGDADNQRETSAPVRKRFSMDHFKNAKRAAESRPINMDTLEGKEAMLRKKHAENRALARDTLISNFATTDKHERLWVNKV